MTPTFVCPVCGAAGHPQAPGVCRATPRHTPWAAHTAGLLTRVELDAVYADLYVSLGRIEELISRTLHERGIS